jgi:hypothetical protein
MPTPLNEAHVNAFYWFAAGWLLAVVGSSVVVVASGSYEWPRVARTAVSLGVMPMLTGLLVVRMSRWLRHYQARHYPES